MSKTNNRFLVTPSRSILARHDSLEIGRQPIHLRESRSRPSAVPPDRSRSQTGKSRNSDRRKHRDVHLDRHTESLGIRPSPGWKTDEIIYASRARRLAASLSGRSREGGRSRIRSRRANSSCAASTASTRRSGKSGSAPAARTRTRIPISSTTIASTSTARAWSADRRATAPTRSQFSPDRTLPHRHLLAGRHAAGPRAAAAPRRQARLLSSKRPTSAS